MDAGRLTANDLNRIIQLQTKENMLFGEAAVSLSVLGEEDIRWALANQYSYPGTMQDDGKISRELTPVHEPFGSQAECFRAIRTSLIFSGAGKQIQAISVTSPAGGEGKTYVAANLALVFAQLGCRTILVDLNFRGPRVHSLFQMKNNCGASSLIIRRALLTDVIQNTCLPSLDILPAGPKPPNPLELLSWEETNELLLTLRTRYEIVIVDTPAFAATADALMTSRVCDGTVVVAKKGVTKANEFGEMKKQFDHAEIPIIGCVLNDAGACH